MEIKTKTHKIFGRPRSSDEEKRSVKVSVFFTPAEAQKMTEKCSATNNSMSHFLRSAALDRRIETRKSVFDSDAVTEMRAIGQNINQTARDLIRAREKMIPVDYKKLETILEKQLEILNALKIKIINSN
jgi:hypothetical protein